jgi:hypothetical protein
MVALMAKYKESRKNPAKEDPEAKKKKRLGHLGGKKLKSLCGPT